MIVYLHFLPNSLFWNTKVIIKIKVKNHLKKMGLKLKLINPIKAKTYLKIVKIHWNQMKWNKQKVF